MDQKVINRFAFDPTKSVKIKNRGGGNKASTQPAQPFMRGTWPSSKRIGEQGLGHSYL